MMNDYVLIVDDDQDARHILGRVASSLGLRISQAVDGVEALAQIKKENPGLIFLDLMMPRMSGFEVLSYLKSTPDLRNIPVIVITGMDTDGGYFQLPGVKRVFSKADYSIREMKELITEFLLVEH